MIRRRISEWVFTLDRNLC